MKSEDLFLEFAWLIKTLQKSDGMTFKALNERWVKDTEFSGGVEFNYSSLHRHFERLAECTGIYITFDQDRQVYYMENKKPKKGAELLEFLFQMVVVNKALKVFVGLDHRIDLQRFSMGEHVIKDVARAIRQNRVVEMVYLPHYSDEVKNHTVLPYGLKMYDCKTYLIGKTKDKIIPFELDRIKELTVTSKPFDMPADFNIHDYYFHYFGVFRDEAIPPEEVVIRTYDNEHKYLDELPIHHSQKKLRNRSGGYHEYKLFVSPTNDFISRIVSRMERIQIMSPQWLVEKVLQRLDRMQNNYKK